MRYIQTIDGFNECYVNSTDSADMDIMSFSDILKSKDIVGVYATSPNCYKVLACKYGVYLSEVKDAKDCMKKVLANSVNNCDIFKDNSIYGQVNGFIDCSDLPVDLSELRFASLRINTDEDDSVFTSFSVRNGVISSESTSDTGIEVNNHYLTLNGFKLVNIPEADYCSFNYIYLFDNKSWLIRRLGKNKVMLIDLYSVMKDGSGVYVTYCSDDFSVVNKDGLELM